MSKPCCRGASRCARGRFMNRPYIYNRRGATPPLSYCGARCSRRRRSGFLAHRPRQLAQVASSATGSAPIAPRTLTNQFEPDPHTKASQPRLGLGCFCLRTDLLIPCTFLNDKAWFSSKKSYRFLCITDKSHPDVSCTEKSLTSVLGTIQTQWECGSSSGAVYRIDKCKLLQNCT